MSTGDQVSNSKFENYKTRTNNLSSRASLYDQINVKSDFYKTEITKDRYNDLSNAIYQLEEQFSNNCCQAYNLNCCQRCQSYSCQSSRGSTCQSCQRCQTFTAYLSVGTAIEWVLEGFCEYSECPTSWQCWQCPPAVCPQ